MFFWSASLTGKRTDRGVALQVRRLVMYREVRQTPHCTIVPAQGDELNSFRIKRRARVKLRRSPLGGNSLMLLP
jgi:hypothetical protein